MPSPRSRSVTSYGQGNADEWGSWWFVSPFMALTALLWRLWKWLSRLFTGKSEVQRLAEAKEALETRTLKIENSIKNSRNKIVRSIASDSSVSVEQAVEILVKEKGLKGEPSVMESLRLSLVRIHSLTLLWEELDSLALQPFSPESQEHERTLQELWDHLMPGSQLEARHTKQWQDIGFQGKDPAMLRLFRRNGIVLGRYCLKYTTFIYAITLPYALSFHT
ncbi:ELMO domain-containing protein 2, partial [Geodia barretti]